MIFIWNWNIFIQENAFENVIWKWHPFCSDFKVLNGYYGNDRHYIFCHLHKKGSAVTCMYKSISSKFWCKYKILFSHHDLCFQVVSECYEYEMNVISTYRKISNIRGTKSQNLNVSCLNLQLSLPNTLKPSFKWRMEMYLEQRRQAMLQLHLSDPQFNCLLNCDLY